jgi:hypothetical protein
MSASFKGFGSIKTNSRNDSIRLDEVIDIIKWVDKKWVTIRVLPIAPLQVRQAWIKLYAGKEKKEISIPRYVVNFDPSNPDTPKKGVRCPYSELVTDKDGPVRVSDFWLFNVIDRDMQEEGPPRKSSKPTKAEAKTGFKDITSETWTPVRVARFTMTSILRLQELSEDNIVKDKKTGKKAQFDASDARYGFDVKVKFKKDAPGTDKYSIDKADSAAALTKEEQGYLVWNLTEELLDATGRMTEKQALEDVKRMELVGGNTLDDDDDDDDKPKKKKGKSRSLDDDDEDEKPKKKKKKPFDDDDDDEDDKPKKKKKKSSKDDDDDEDEKPKKKLKKKSKSDDDDEDEKPKKKKKKSSDDDDDEKPKKKLKKKSKDDDDEKPKKKKAKVEEKKGGAKKKVAKKGKKKSSWDDE